jgi:CheY-like chemotaxis protein
VLAAAVYAGAVKIVWHAFCTTGPRQASALKRVLVVDDEPDIRTVVGQVLRDAGYTVFVAANGAEALERMRKVLPHGIVLDLHMPVMDGQTFLRFCRADPVTEDVPVGVISTELNPLLLSQSLDVQAVLPKPFDLDELVDMVDRLVGGPAEGLDAMGMDVAPRAAVTDVAPRAAGMDVALEAAGVDVALEAALTDVSLEAALTDVALEAAGVDVAPEAAGMVVAPEAAGMVMAPDAAAMDFALEAAGMDLALEAAGTDVALIAAGPMKPTTWWRSPSDLHQRRIADVTRTEAAWLCRHMEATLEDITRGRDVSAGARGCLTRATVHLKSSRVLLAAAGIC